MLLEANVGRGTMMISSTLILILILSLNNIAC